MAHIALVITGLTGKLHASFEMVSRLEDEGHKVTYMCPLDVRKQVERHGFEFVKIPEINFGFSGLEYEHQHPNWIVKLKYHFKNRKVNYEKGKKLLRLEEYKEIMQNIAPDKVVADMEMHDLILTAISLNIPITLFTTWFSDKKSMILPPIRSAIVPGKGFNGSRLGILKARMYFRLRFRIKLVLDALRFNNYRRMVLKRYALEVGIPSEEIYPNNFPSLFSYRKLPIVTMALQELDFAHKPAKNFKYAWPMVYAKREISTGRYDVNEQLSRAFDMAGDTNKKLIYCSLGTFIKGDVDFLHKVIKVVEKEPNWILVLSSKNELFESGEAPTAENIFVFKTVPQLKVLQQADCCINHGGINTINECIHFAVPMLVYSGKNYDQNGCGARVAYHGLGISADKDKDDIEAIHDNVHQILNQGRYKKKVMEYNAIYKQQREKKLAPVLGIK